MVACSARKSGGMADPAAHWTEVWANKDPADTSWHQDAPEPCSLLIREVSTPASRVAIVGVGVSPLIADLLSRGYEQLEVIDIAGDALQRLRGRLGPEAGRVRIREADACVAVFDAPVDVWHDRATFHFLTDPADRSAYVRSAARAVRPSGHLIVGTFALDGPDQCSGLPVVRYDAGSLATEFADGFDLVESVDHDHLTPWGARQPFVHVVLRRSSAGLKS